MNQKNWILPGSLSENFVKYVFPNIYIYLLQHKEENCIITFQSVILLSPYFLEKDKGGCLAGKDSYIDVQNGLFQKL